MRTEGVTFVMANHNKLYFAFLVSFLLQFPSSTIALRQLSSIYGLPKTEGMKGYWSSSSESSICCSTTEGGTIQLSCSSAGGVISNILFASFGDPQGSCGGSYSKGNCDSPQALSIVEQACLHKQSCTLEVSEAMFGTVNCAGTKKLVVEATC